ncbi:MAG: 2-amino-4-oxopentanoate thiolase subunit OrtA [Candidatus Izemoplasmataceae bacterium]
MNIDKGTYVRIRKTLLQPSERSENLPEDTKKVPLKMWVKGRMLEEGELFDYAHIKTITGRIEYGRVKEIEPPYKHGFGDFVEELLQIREIIIKDVYGGENNE